MTNLVFTPNVDLPLVFVTLGLFIWHFNHWAYRNDIETSVDIPSRLPAARVRVIGLFSVLLIVCWFLNFPVWSIFAALLAVGLGIAMIGGGDIDGGGFGLFAAACFIREWSFGFPQLILHPPKAQVPTSIHTSSHELVGQIGTASSPLRPSGDAVIGGTCVAVMSDDGCLIDAGTDVIVTSYRNGRLCVRSFAGSMDADNHDMHRSGGG